LTGWYTAPRGGPAFDQHRSVTRQDMPAAFGRRSAERVSRVPALGTKQPSDSSYRPNVGSTDQVLNV
jgi:hypothetical protein